MATRPRKKSYSAQVKDWNEKAKRNTDNIMRTSIQELVRDAQTPVAQGGSMPVDTGNLRNSLISGLNGTFGPEDDTSYVLTIANMKRGDTANFAWSAVYARARHYKPESFGQGGGMWRDKAAAKWQSIVDAAARKFGQ